MKDEEANARATNAEPWEPLPPLAIVASVQPDFQSRFPMTALLANISK